MDYKLLTAEEEIDLARRRDSGDRSALDTLVERNQALAMKIAAPYVKRHQRERDDLIAAAMQGLVVGAIRFDPARGTRFSTSATWWIKHYVAKHEANAARLIYVPVHFQDNRSKKVGTDAMWAAAGRALGFQAGSHADPVEAARLLASIPSRPEPEADDEYPTEWVPLVLSRLTERQRFILTRRFGLDGSEPTSLAVLGQEMGISKERVSQLEKKAKAAFSAAFDQVQMARTESRSAS